MGQRNLWIRINCRVPVEDVFSEFIQVLHSFLVKANFLPKSLRSCCMEQQTKHSGLVAPQLFP